MKKKKTIRGFEYVEFEDIYGQKCSMQKSSLATRDAIWFGIDNTGNEIKDEITNKFNTNINARMHIDIKLAEELIEHLKRFVTTGEI